MTIHCLFRGLCLAAILVLNMAVATAQAASILLQSDSPSAANGDSVTLDVLVSGLGDFGPASLGAFDLSIDFDPGVFAFSSYTLGALLGDIDSGEALDASFGNIGTAINLAAVSLLSSVELHALQPSEFVLASVTFDVFDLAPGATSSLGAFGVLLVDENGALLPVSQLGSFEFTGSANTSVPLPATWLLVLAGVLGLHRRRRVRFL